MDIKKFFGEHRKGAFCKYCTLFPSNSNSFRGVLGSFIIRPFCKFKDIHEHCKKHMKTHFHKMALEAAKSFLGSVPVDLQLNKYSQGIIEENRKIITLIISCITFFGSHDLALRGIHYGEGILELWMWLRLRNTSNAFCNCLRERVTDEIIKDATVVAEKVGLEKDTTSMPRIVRKQRHQSNHPAESPSEFWKRSLIIPYNILGLRYYIA
ncbi:hypothetical protein ACJJTC_014207 [Scirpophaga incertulas]